MTRIGILTGGGDCPGLNAVIRAATLALTDNDHEVVGVRAGWRGMVEHDWRTIAPDEVAGLLAIGGTVLGSSRTNPFKDEASLERVIAAFAELDALIAIGGEDTLGVAHRLHAEHGLPVVGVPKTIDNDLGATDQTFGFDTAVSIATEAVDRLRTTGESHARTMILEVMGRHAGWIAVWSGLAGGAHAVLVPEFPMSVEEVARLVEERRGRGHWSSIIVVSEGWPFTSERGEARLGTRAEKVDAFGHVQLGGVGEQLAHALEELTGVDTRATVLGYIQRGGTPTAFDRVLATRYGLLAAELVAEGRFGQMAALRGGEVVPVPLSDAVRELRTVPREIYELTRALTD